MKKPRKKCPICGISIVVGALQGHVASDRCRLLLEKNGYTFADPKNGGFVYTSAEQLQKWLKEVPVE